MSSFAGVSMVIGGEVHTTPAVDVGTDRGYHLLVVKDYERTVRGIPNGTRIKSRPFIVGGHQWCIDYYPNGDIPSSADFISLYVRHGEDNIENQAEARLEFSFVHQVGMQNPTYIRSIEICSFSIKDGGWGYREFIKRDVLEKSAHLNEDCFIIRCDIMVSNDLSPQQDAVVADIGQHFEILLHDKVGSDVTFEVSGELFPAHRCVLAARSKVFKAQLFGPMKEGITSGVIHIKDMEPKVFAALLSFIYTDTFPSMDEEEEGQDGEDESQQEEEEGQEDEAAEHFTWLQDLFVAADRYDIQKLKFLCEMKLSEHIGVSSVASTLALAQRHQCHGLKEECLKFIQVQSPKRLGRIMKTDGWEHLGTTYRSVLDELIAKLASNQKTDTKRKR